MQRLRLAAISLGVATVALLAGELLWRALDLSTHDERSHIEFVSASLAQLEPCARLVRQRGATWIHGDARPYRLPFSLPLDRSDEPGAIRIAVVGESTGAQLAFGAQDLAARLPELAAFEVLNCAVPGTSLEHVETATHEVLEYRPNVLVVVFGHNFAIQHPGDSARLRMLALRGHSRMLTGLAARLVPGRGSDLVTMEPIEARLARLEAWLDALAAETRRRDVSLVLVRPASNLWMPPPADDRTRMQPALLEARYELARGETDAALRRLEQALLSEPTAHGHFTAGTWTARAGSHAAAERHLRLALDGQQTDTDRATSAVAAILEAAAREHEIPMLDLEEAAATAADGGLPDWTVMMDNCHVQGRLLDRESAGLFALAQAATGVAEAERVTIELPPTPSFHRFGSVLEGLTYAQSTRAGASARRNSDAIELAIEQWLALDRPAVDAAVASYLEGVNFTAATDPDRRSHLLMAIAAGYWHGGARATALDMNRRARETGTAEPWVQLGLFRVAAGELGPASDAFERASEISPQRPDAALFVARARASREDGADGRR